MPDTPELRNAIREMEIEMQEFEDEGGDIPQSVINELDQLYEELNA